MCKVFKLLYASQSAKQWTALWELLSPPLITSRTAYKQKNTPAAHFSIKSQNQEQGGPKGKVPINPTPAYAELKDGPDVSVT